MNRIGVFALLVSACVAQLVLAQQADSGPDGSFQPVGEVNKQLPKWLQLSGSYRSRFEDQDGIGFKDVSDSHLLGQFWFGTTIRPASWLTFFGQLQDARMYFNGVLPKASPNANSWDLRQAWVQFGNPEKYPVSVRFGRQELAFGEQRLIGTSLWVNAPRVFDAALVTLNYHSVRVDAFASSVVNNVNGLMDHHKQGNPFYGVYGSLTHLVKNASIEPYYLWRLAPPGYSAAYASGATGHLDEKTYGLRWAGKLPVGFDYSAEAARQFGDLGPRSIGAWAGHWNVGKTFQTKLKPRPFVEYNYASGTADPLGRTIGTFDQLYPSGHDKLGETDQIGWRNIRDLRTGVELKPTRKLAVSGIYHDYWLANARDGLYTATGSVVAKSLAGTAGTHVGQELDIEGTCAWNKAVLFGAGFGHLFSGEFLNKTAGGRDYNYPYIMANYRF